jgi:hypothetical protein
MGTCGPRAGATDATSAAARRAPVPGGSSGLLRMLSPEGIQLH